MVGVVHKVLVKTNDKVFAGEPLIQLADDELARAVGGGGDAGRLARARAG